MIYCPFCDDGILEKDEVMKGEYTCNHCGRIIGVADLNNLKKAGRLNYTSASDFPLNEQQTTANTTKNAMPNNKERTLVIQELKKEIEIEQKKVDDLNTKILAAYNCASMYPLRRSGFESDARKFSDQKKEIEQQIEWKCSVLSKYNCY